MARRTTGSGRQCVLRPGISKNSLVSQACRVGDFAVHSPFWQPVCYWVMFYSATMSSNNEPVDIDTLFRMVVDVHRLAEFIGGSEAK